MTNFEITKRLLSKEFTEWLFQLEKENKNTIEPIWCKNRNCEDVNGDCQVCFTKWLNSEIKETEE